MKLTFSAARWVGCPDEISVSEGALGTIMGRDLLPLLMGYADRAEKFGA